MKGHVERQSGILPAKKPRRQRQMRRAADGKEFRKPLKNAEYERLENRHRVDSPLREVLYICSY